MEVDLNQVTIYRANTPNWNPLRPTINGRDEWFKTHYLSRYGIVCPSKDRGRCTNPIFGLAEEDEDYFYCYTRLNFRSNTRDNKLGGVVVFPKKDGRLIQLECPDLFTNNYDEYTRLDSNGMLFNYPAKSFEDSVMTYDKFILEYTQDSDMCLGNDINLRYMYSMYNKKYFENKLPYNLKVVWSNRMVETAGRYNFTRRQNGSVYNERITISVKYHAKYEDDLVSTMLHEMIHVYLPTEGHSNGFKYHMNVLSRESGTKITVYTSGRVNERAIKWVLICKNCGKTYERTRETRDIGKYHCGVSGCRGRLIQLSYDKYKEMHG